MYKVVHVVEGKRWRHSWSLCNLAEEYCLKYQKNRVTRPKIGKVFAFIDIDSAERFRRNLNGTEIWECEGENSIPITVLLDWSYLQVPARIRDWWKLWPLQEGTAKNIYSSVEAPTGTVACDSIKLTRRIAKRGEYVMSEDRDRGVVNPAPKSCPYCNRPLNILYGTNEFTIWWIGQQWVRDEERSIIICTTCYEELDQHDIEDIMQAVDLL